MPSRARVYDPRPAPPRPAPRSLTAATSGKILVAAVAAGAVVPAVQTLDTSHSADAESTATTQLSAAQMSLAAQHGAPGAASAQHAISDVSTVVMSSDQLAAAAKPASSGVDDLSKAMSVARENGPLEFGRPYVAGNDSTLNGQIAKALGLMGLPQKLAPGVKQIIMRESTGNADAVNGWDSNAAAGTPSKGLMQLIDTTFRNAVLPSLADKGIFDPVANITAGVRTMIANHGIGAVEDGGLTNSSGGYVGYGGAKLPDDGLGRAS
ncbi:transglycosylase SLT domain-containing protein [Actinomycetospora sp. TBRC 11914]|uniref:transglycosylase SLT domain-containing protein n=1 Tax=Actinomycetospora sp. TBRC 11914 TaxID=2729387 RepID=UPI00145C88FF|nr:transglycosylase SLT domain-containing protein [Actinomycetospora sp. TBRC 11914]NMO92037.1 transglycosylase SLT domain-containing protein [Actinomycetospora sp. TBRC 11914]